MFSFSKSHIVLKKLKHFLHIIIYNTSCKRELKLNQQHDNPDTDK